MIPRIPLIAALTTCLLISACPAQAQSAPSTTQSSLTPNLSQPPSPTAPPYTLPPDKFVRAIAFSCAKIFLYFASTAWTLFALLLLLALHVPSRFRDWAERCTPQKWLQGFIFLPLFLLTLSLTGIPFVLFGQHLSLEYGQSIQHWGSWFWDWTKALLLTLVFGTLVLSLLARIIRRSPRRWWLWFWLATIPLLIFGTFISPILIDPLFNKFEPLQKTDPTLVTQLEQVVAHGGLKIPPSRMYWMRASAKVTSLNAYVTGFGSSKRIVVWDTTIQKARPDEIQFIFGHEMGHYVLNHIYKGLAFAFGIAFVMLWLIYHSANWLTRRFGAAWQIRVPNSRVGDDWAALAVLFLAFTFYGFLFEPLANSFSRLQEHHADIYGQEAIHGIVANPQQTAQQAFQLLGEIGLDDPNPNPFVEFWAYSHPSIAHRAAFAAHYNPWLPGRHPRYFQK